MKYHLQILEEVYEELEEAADYYFLQQPGLEMKLFRDWERAVQDILESPEGFQKQRKNFRQILLQNFPYIIVYEILDSKIIIYRFINAKKHPVKRYSKRKI
jgi:plasmid stabilization system protein ParE